MRLTLTPENSPTPWIDEESCAQLPILRAQGEGQHLEFKREFPSQIHELAKEIAAFATSNSGIILLGVDDSGNCIGLPNVSTPEERDVLSRRIEGVCHGPVKPSITPSLKFAQESGRTVLLLTVPKGSQPLYYANHIPYVRHISSSRPAEPHEVIELIQGMVRITSAETHSVEESPSKRVQFLGRLLGGLNPVLIFGEELDERMVNPWLDLVRAQFGNTASRLRELAVEQIAVDEKLDVPLLDAADELNQFTKIRLHLGSGPELTAAANRAISKINALIERIGPEVIAFVDPRQLKEHLETVRRQLSMLEKQAEQARVEGGITELQATAAELGRRILSISQYGVNRLAPELRSSLMSSGHNLHLAETERVYLDGGASSARIVDRIQQAIQEFHDATQPILGSR